MKQASVHAFLDGQYKDRSPMETVELIRGILAKNGLETQELWHETKVPYCYALSIKLLGTTFRVNGKGLTREFALASGYGELMERLQMGFLFGPNVLKDGDFTVDSGKYEMLPASQLLSANRNWYEKMCAAFHRLTGGVLTPEQIINQYADAEGKVSVTPYYSLTQKAKVYLPTILRKRAYATSGCAAGNTVEEAIVQGLCEIVERHHQLRIIEEGLCLPDVPEEDLKKCAAAYEIITYVRSHGYKVIIKDASLGTGYPVVCACIIHEKTGRYHTHFGAYPIFEIALERSLTESFQGRNIDNIATFESFSFRKSGTFSLKELSSELNIGSCEKRPEFFLGEQSYAYDPHIGFSGKNNRELLAQCVAYFRDLGYDILVRDRSCLGFPTCQVIVPGYSEAQINRLSRQMDDHRYAPQACKTLRCPGKATVPDMLGLIMHLSEMDRFFAEARGVRGFLTAARITADLPAEQENFLLSASLCYVFYALGRRAQVLQSLEGMLPTANGEDLEYLICLKRYLSLLEDGRDCAYAEKVISFFHSRQAVDRLLSLLSKRENPFQDYVLQCQMQCTPDCPIFAACCHKRVVELSRHLDKQMEKRSFQDFANGLLRVL